MAGGEVFFFNETATTEIYTLSLHDALPISRLGFPDQWAEPAEVPAVGRPTGEYVAFKAGLTITAVAFMVALVVTIGVAWAAWRVQGRGRWGFAPAGLLVVVEVRRGSGRGRGEISVVAVSLKKK